MVAEKTMEKFSKSPNIVERAMVKYSRIVVQQ